MLFIGFLLLAICLVFGGAFVLLRTTNRPKVPKDFKPKVFGDDDESSG